MYFAITMYMYVYHIHMYVFSVIKVAGEKQVDVVPAFVSSLGSQLYDTTSDQSSYDFETIITILQVRTYMSCTMYAFCSTNPYIHTYAHGEPSV